MLTIEVPLANLTFLVSLLTPDYLEVFPVQYEITFPENGIPGSPQHILLSNVAHIEDFLVMDLEVGLVEVGHGDGCDEGQRPEYESFEHKHSETHGQIA